MKKKYLLHIFSIAVFLGVAVPGFVQAAASCSCAVEFSAQNNIGVSAGQDVQQCSGSFRYSFPADGSEPLSTLGLLLIDSVDTACTSAMPTTLGDLSVSRYILPTTGGVFWLGSGKQIRESNCESASTQGAYRSIIQRGIGDEVFYFEFEGTCSLEGAPEEPEKGQISLGTVAARYQILNQFDNVGTGQGAVNRIIGRIIYVSLTIMGSIALIMFIYAGLNWMVRGGNPEAQKKSMSIMVWTVLGVAVLLGAAGIVDFIFGALPTP